MTETEQLQALGRIATEALQKQNELLKKVFVLEILLGASGIEDIDEAVRRGLAVPEVAAELRKATEENEATLNRVQQYLAAQRSFGGKLPPTRVN